MSNTGLGITGEAGEVADLIKKHLHHGHELDKEHLALGATVIGYELEDILQMNVNKLRKRYPDGFDAQKSQHREKGDE